MLPTYIIGAITVVVVAFTLGRVIWRVRDGHRAILAIREREARLKAAATPVIVIDGVTRLGRGKRKATTALELVSDGFAIRAPDGATTQIAPGAIVMLFASAARLHDDGTVELPADTNLLYLPHDPAPDAGPYQTPGATAHTPGDKVFLLTRDTDLLNLDLLARRLSIPRVVTVVAVTAGSLAGAIAYGPNTRFNVLPFVFIFLCILDLVTRGALSWYVLTRERRAAA